MPEVTLRLQGASGLLHPPRLPTQAKGPGEVLFTYLFIFKEPEVVKWVLK